MNRLLSANFMRLRKAKEFWLCALASLLISASMIISGSRWALQAAERGVYRTLDDYFFQIAPYTGAILAIFISLFLGTEYSDGTVRNKVIAGHTRTGIYLANLLTCLAGGGVITALWFAGGLPGLWLIGGFDMGLSGVIVYFLVAIGFTAAFTAIFVWISMLSRNKAFTVVRVLVLWVALVVVGSGVNDRLDVPEFDGGMALINGEFVMLEDTPNPLYLTGAARAVFECLARLLPAAQAIDMTAAEITTPWLDIAASGLVAALVTALGVRSFRRKDLK